MFYLEPIYIFKKFNYYKQKIQAYKRDGSVEKLRENSDERITTKEKPGISVGTP